MTDVDKKNIYNALVNLLTMHCDTCLDKHQMEKILLCTFKLELIEYAELNEQDTDELWESIARILNIKLNGVVQTTAKRKCNCSNGVCTLC